jgi:hypothetical protein
MDQGLSSSSMQLHTGIEHQGLKNYKFEVSLSSLTYLFEDSKARYILFSTFVA